MSKYSAGGGAHSGPVLEIAARVVALAEGMDPPRHARMRALYPDAHCYQLNEGYRLGCLDLILGPRTGRPLLGETATERAVIRDRIARLRQWKDRHGHVTDFMFRPRHPGAGGGKHPSRPLEAAHAVTETVPRSRGASPRTPC